MAKAMTLKLNRLAYQRQEKIIFTPISLELIPGDLLLVQGANGAGKSSLLRLLAGLVQASSGNISWQQVGIDQQHADYIQYLHYIGHQNGLKLGLTVKENLKLFACLTRSTLVSEISEQVLIELELFNHQNTLAKKLSAGQQRRLALAKLFLFPKKIWILDEPLTALDQKIQEKLLIYLKKHLENKGIAIISSHHAIALENYPLKKLILDTPC